MSPTQKLLRLVIAGILFAILVVSLIDVGGRYLFNAPLLGADDLIRFGMAILVFAALPEVCRSREHVSVDLLSHVMAPKLRGASTRLFGIVAAALLVYLAWRLAEVGLNALDYGDRSPLLRIPYAPLAFLLALFALVAAGIEFLLAVRPAPVERG
jgi:TRAP-type C4-dicarboxylate transport system permease small subunit